MLVPAGAEAQPQQPATFPVAPPRLLAHSQWAVLPAPRKPSRRAALQPRPGSAASRIAAGAAGWSGDAGAGVGSVEQVGLADKESHVPKPGVPARQKDTLVHCSRPAVGHVPRVSFSSSLLATLPGQWGLQGASQASTRTAVPLMRSATVACHDRVGHLLLEHGACSAAGVIPLCICGLQAGAPVQPQAPPAPTGAPSEAGSSRAGQLAAGTGGGCGLAGQQAGAAAQDSPAAQPAASSPTVVKPPPGVGLGEVAASAKPAMRPQGRGKSQGVSAAPPPAGDESGAAADQQQPGKQGRQAEVEAVPELRSVEGVARSGPGSLVAGLSSDLPAPNASGSLLGLAAAQEPQGSAAEPEGVRWELAGFSPPAASPTAGEQQQSPAASADCLGGSRPDRPPQVSAGQPPVQRRQLPAQAEDCRSMEGHARRAEAAAAAGWPPAQAAAARPASAPQGAPGRSLTEIAAPGQQQHGAQRSGLGPRIRALQQHPRSGGLKHLAGRPRVRRGGPPAQAAAARPASAPQGAPGQSLTEIAATGQQQHGAQRSGQGPRIRALQQHPRSGGLEHLAGQPPAQSGGPPAVAAAARPNSAPQGAPGQSLTEKMVAAWKKQQGSDASGQEPNIMGLQQQLGRGGRGQPAGVKQKLAVAALPEHQVSSSLPGQQAARAPQQQQGGSGRLRQPPPVRASAMGQAVTSPPPPAASVLQLPANPAPLWPTAAAPRPWSAPVAPAPQGTVASPLREQSAALMPQQHSSRALEQHHTVAPNDQVVLQSLPDAEQVQSLAMLRQAQLQYGSAVEALLRTAEELQGLPGVQQFLHRAQDDVQVGACLAGCSCWSAVTAVEPAKASSMHMMAAPEPQSLGHCMHCKLGPSCKTPRQQGPCVPCALPTASGPDSWPVVS